MFLYIFYYFYSASIVCISDYSHTKLYLPEYFLVTKICGYAICYPIHLCKVMHFKVFLYLKKSKSFYTQKIPIWFGLTLNVVWPQLSLVAFFSLHAISIILNKDFVLNQAVKEGRDTVITIEKNAFIYNIVF